MSSAKEEADATSVHTDKYGCLRCRNAYVFDDMNRIVLIGGMEFNIVDVIEVLGGRRVEK